mgnify:CR=1 FL=1
MKVTYATDRVGKINKSVTITSNATNAPTKVVRIIRLIRSVLIQSSTNTSIQFHR